MNIEVNRLFSVPANSEYLATTTGTISLDGTQTCFSLERTATLIPAGTYPVKLQMSKRFSRKTPWILNVPAREDIEMHGANTAMDVDGCIGCAEKRLSDYEIYDSEPATTAIEEALAQAEANGEASTVTIS